MGSIAQHRQDRRPGRIGQEKRHEDSVRNIGRSQV
jgi:hypothetical protein